MIVATTTFIACLVMAIFILYRYAEPNRLRRVLIGVLSFWVLIFGLSLVEMLQIGTNELEKAYLLEFRQLYAGLFALFVYMIYPSVAIYPRFFLSPNILAALIPSLLSYTLYFWWCGSNNISPTMHFNTLEELLMPQYRGVFVLRLVIFFSFYIFYGVVLHSFNRIIELYQNYVESIYSDTYYNVHWLKKYTYSLVLICAVYTISAISTGVLTYWIYVIGAVVTFMILVDNSLKYKPFEQTSRYDVRWSLSQGWHVESESQEPESIEPAEEDDLFIAFETWIKQDKPFCNDGFTTNDVITHLTTLDYRTLAEMLKTRGYTFQSYVRKQRIAEAVLLMNDGYSSLSLKQIAYKVGFSHPSSFSRAFLAEMDCRPTEYYDKLVAKKA